MLADASVETEREIFMRSLAFVPPPTALVREFTRLVKDVEFPTGSKLFVQGEPSGELYFTIRGRVELSAPSQPSWTFDEGSVIGVFDALLDRPHARSAIALSPVKALAIDATSYFEVLEDDFEYARSLVTNVATDTWQKVLEIGGHGELGPRSPTPAGGEIAQASENMVDRIQLLLDSEPFLHMPTQALVLLGLHAEAVELDSGIQFLAPDSLRDRLWVVASGRVRLLHDRLNAEFGPRALVGGLGAFAGPEASFGAETMEPTTLLQIHFEDLVDVMEEHFPVLRALMRYGTTSRERVMNLAAERARALVEGPG